MTGDKKRTQTNPNSLANLKPAKKGEVRNPEGARTHDPVKKAMKKLTAPGWEEILNVALTGTIKDLQELADSPTLSGLQIGVARAMYNAAAAGNWDRLKDMVVTLLGPQAIKIDITNKNIDETPEEKEERRKRVSEQLAAMKELDE